MANLFIDVGNIVDRESDGFGNIEFLIVGQPDYGTTNTQLLVGHVAKRGYLDSDGQANIDLPASADGTWMQFQLPQYNLSAGFVMPGTDADLGDLIRTFNPPGPGPSPGPTPTPIPGETQIQGYSLSSGC